MMAAASGDSFGSQPWYQTVAIVLLVPIVFLTIPIVLAVIFTFGMVGLVANFIADWRMRALMQRRGRFLSYRVACSRIESVGGTLIVESPSLGCGHKWVWWTPDDVLATCPFSMPTDADYRRAATQMQCLDWDRWCWEKYTSPNTGHAYLIRIWNESSLERKLKSRYPSLGIVAAWTGLVHFPPPEVAPKPN